MSGRIVPPPDLAPVATPPAPTFVQGRPICDRLLTVREVTARISLCRAEIYKLARRGKFPVAVKLGSSARWSEIEVAEWIEQQKTARVAGR